jgi:hypothetical protein
LGYSSSVMLRFMHVLHNWAMLCQRGSSKWCFFSLHTRTHFGYVNDTWKLFFSQRINGNYSWFANIAKLSSPIWSVPCGKTVSSHG